MSDTADPVRRSPYADISTLEDLLVFHTDLIRELITTGDQDPKTMRGSIMLALQDATDQASTIYRAGINDALDATLKVAQRNLEAEQKGDKQ